MLDITCGGQCMNKKKERKEKNGVKKRSPAPEDYLMKWKAPKKAQIEFKKTTEESLCCKIAASCSLGQL